MRFINKKVIIIPIFLLMIFVLLINFKIELKNKNNKLDEVKLVNNNINNNGFAIMVEGSNGEYTESSSNTWPIDKKFNKYLSGCLDGFSNKVENALQFNSETNEVSVKTNGAINCYLYFDISGEDKEFTYTGSYEVYNVSHTGYYQIEASGGSGGKSICDGEYCDTIVGKGGYTKGIIKLNEGEKLYIYVGGAGSNASVGVNSLGGYNGGGLGTWDNSDNESSGGGGGASDIRYFGNYTPTNDDLLWNSEIGLNSRIMVAAGGGGASWSYTAGDGGGLHGKSSEGFDSVGTQNSGYAFGYGQNAEGTADSDGVGGGGSGYYGGYANNVAYKSSGTGGSSFISGYAGVNAITSSSDRTHTNNTLHYSGKYFINSEIKAAFNEGNGMVKITFISSSKPTRINTKLDNVRYIKDCTKGNTVNEGNHIVEMQAIYNGLNISFSKVPVESHGYLEWGSEVAYTYATDGRIDNITDSSGYAESDLAIGKEFCLVIDLGDVYNLDEIAVWHYWKIWRVDRTYYDNYTYVSSDNKNWIKVIDKQEPETVEGKRVNAYS